MKYFTTKTLLASMLVISCFTGCASSIKPELTQKQKAVALLNSIQSGDKRAINYVNPEQYIQHNLAVKDGLAGFGELMKELPKDSAKVDVIRAFEDGAFVFTHTKYNFFGPKVGFDIFRFENGKIVEHWDNLQKLETRTASGRSQYDGPAKSHELEKTEQNKALVKNFVQDVLFGKKPQNITRYISTKMYHQHNPHVKDGLTGLREALKALAAAGMPMVYEKNHKILGEGNFVLAVSEGIFMKKHVAFYDLFRVENDKIVEHWDTIEQIPKKTLWKNNNGKF